MQDLPAEDQGQHQDDERLEVWLDEVDALLRAGRPGDAIEHAARTVATAADESRAAARLRVTMSSMLVLGGHAAAARELLDALLLEPDLPVTIVTAANQVRLLAVMALNDLPQARQMAEDILAGSDRPGSDADLSTALTALAFAAWDGGGVTDAVALLRAAAHRADNSAVDGCRMLPHLRLASALVSLGELSQAEEALNRSGRELRQCEDLLWTAGPTAGWANLHLARGGLDDAEAAAKAALAISAELGTWLFAPLGYAVLASVALRRGRLGEVAARLDQLRMAAASTTSVAGSEAAAWIEVRLADALGDRDRTRRAMTTLAAGLPVHCRLLEEEPAASGWLTRVALGAGGRRVAETVVRRAEMLAASNPSWATIVASADHARGVLSQDVQRLQRACDGYRDPWTRASAAEDAAVVHLGHASVGAGRQLLERALGDYRTAGATWDAARVSRRLAATVVRPHARRPCRPVSGWGSLTETERRVAEVVAEGFTNASAAERLYLSRHTVDFHLRQIFRKLAIRSRVELVRMVLQADEH
ncbi:MAG: hypothetical protein JWM05_3406 [Acidimicrobiales bacterium]|nr:hypothetical protein [Acidimicrobiales bacterium]